MYGSLSSTPADGGIAGVVFQRAGLVDDPVPRDAAVLAHVGQRVVQVLIGPARAGALLADLPPRCTSS